jgi:DNA-binding LytR/AlgR family response regulator
MKVLIIEDEALSARALERTLKTLRPDWELAGCTTSIEASLRFLAEHKDIDIILSDIRLDDGLSFAIFDRIETKAAVVFVTGYDEYALRAFDYNCADYLMKPVQKSDLEKALKRCEERFPRLTPSMLKSMSRDIMERKVDYRRRLLLEQGSRTLVASVEEVSYITSDVGGTKVFLRNGTCGYIDSPLSRLETELSPELFARVNRQFIVALDAIKAFDELPGKRECALVLKDPHGATQIHISIPKRKELTGLLY